MTRTEQKQKYNKEKYTQVKISAYPEVAEAFKNACIKNGVSQSIVLQRAMADYIGSIALMERINRLMEPTPSPYNTLRKRKKAVEVILNQLEEIFDWEQSCVESTRNDKTRDSAESRFNTLDEAIAQIKSVYEI